MGLKRDMRPLAERFWEQVDTSGECWTWTGGRLPSGYGRLQENKRTVLAHRVSWELHFGGAVPKLLVLHHCDNPPCVRPSHLFLGTHKDNAEDRERKGRGNQASGDNSGARRKPETVRRGDTSGMHRLTEQDVHAIRLMYSTGGWTQRGLGQHFNVAHCTIGNVLRGTTWKHVQERVA